MKGIVKGRMEKKIKVNHRLQWTLPFLAGARPLNLGRYTLFRSEINNLWCLLDSTLYSPQSESKPNHKYFR